MTKNQRFLLLACVELVVLLMLVGALGRIYMDKAVAAAATPAPTEAPASAPAATAAPTPTFSPEPTATPYVNQPPVIRLLGAEPYVLPAQPMPYEDPGCMAEDDRDGDLTDRVEVTVDVNPYHAGEGTVTYTVTDSEGETATAVRHVTITAVALPETVTPEGKVIYLTFDDGPSANTDTLLSILRAYGVEATWFVTDNWPEYRDKLRDIAAAGHTVAIHSASHDYNEIYQSEDAYFADLRRMQSIILEETGVFTSLVRFPGGSSNTVSSYNPGIMSALSRDLTDMGYTYFDWNVSSEDATAKTNYDSVIKNVTEGVKKERIAIVLQHDTKDFSVRAVEAILNWGFANGYIFLPLDAASPTAHHVIQN